MSHRARRLFIVIHLWLGLILGLWFSLIGVSGSVLAWRTELGAAELSRRFPIQKTTPDAQILTLDQASASLKRAFPNLDLETVGSVGIPTSKANFYNFSVGRNRRTAQSVLLNPYDGSVMGTVAPRSGTVATIQQFHQRLIAGMRGYVFNGFLTALSIPLLLSGLWLWWPSNGKQLRARLTVKRGTPLHRRLYDLHNVLGIYLYGILLMATVTGALLVVNHISRDDWAQTIKELREGEAPPAREGRGEGNLGARNGARRPETGGANANDKTPKVEASGARLKNDVLLENARKAVPIFQIGRVQFPKKPDEPFVANYSLSSGFALNRTLYLNPYTGAVLPFKEPGANYQSVVKGLHLGDFGGLTSKILYTFTGLIPLGLFVTGLWMWARKKAKSRARDVGKAPF